MSSERSGVVAGVAQVAPGGAPPTGTIHDQGYERYQGERLPQARRLLVVARNVLAVAWKSRWGVKLPLLGAVLTLVVSAAVMIVATTIAGHAGGREMQFLRADNVMFRSYPFFSACGILLSLTVAASSVADDLTSGAFQFYFSRPLRPDDYVRGKLLGLFALVGVATLAAPVLLAIVRVCLADDLKTALATVPLVGRTFLVGVAGTAALVLPAMGLAATMGKRMAAQAAFVVYWVVLSTVAMALAEGLHQPQIALLSLVADIAVVAAELFRVAGDTGLPPPWQAGLAILFFTAGSYALVRARVRSGASAGIGGV
jgi:ABC-2 type transport system permease protein